VSLAVFPTAGKAPVGAVILITLLCLILRRILVFLRREGSVVAKPAASISTTRQRLEIL
jgi:hypothetical protein